MKKGIILVLALVSSFAFASKDIYYPAEYKTLFLNSNVSETNFRNKLFDLFHKGHLKQNGKADVLVDSCSGHKNCYYQKRLSYKKARTYVFNKLHLVIENNLKKVKDVYCEKTFTENEVALGGNNIPHHTIVNVEHTWPKDRFTNNYPSAYQKSDLHHLFPTDQGANSTRSTRMFADVYYGKPVRNCDRSQYDDSHPYFEPPAQHKGNVARAIFYFAVRYKGQISKREEDALRRWHEQDPVDEAERIRNDKIYELQGNRNPFIDYPELVSRISDY
jgi:endonuclease I